MAWDLLGIQGNIESAGVSALKSPAVQGAGRTFLVDMFSRITSQNALYSGKANDIANISKNLTDNDIQDFDFTKKDTWKNSLVNILTNKGLFNDDFKLPSVENIIDSSIAKTVADNLKSHSVNIKQDTIQPNNIDSIDKIKNILQDIKSELLKQNAPVSDGLNNLLDAQIELHKDKLEKIAKNAGENAAKAGFALGETFLNEKAEKETKATQVDTHLKNVIDKITNITDTSDADIKIISNDIMSADIGSNPYARTDIVIALINQNEDQNFSVADKAILTQSIQDIIKSNPNSEIQLAEITRDDMINIITDFKGKLLKANAPHTAQARALIDTNAEYAQEKIKNAMQGALFSVTGVNLADTQDKLPLEVFGDAVVKIAKEKLTQSQADIGKTIINGVMQALGNVVPSGLKYVGGKVADAVGQKPLFDKGIKKIQEFAPKDSKMELALKLGGGLAGVLLATKLFSMGLGTIFSPTPPPPPPPPPKTVTDFLWNNSPWIGSAALMAASPVGNLMGGLWNNMFGRTNHQAQMPAMPPQYMNPYMDPQFMKLYMEHMQQNTTPEPQAESPLTAMDAMMAIFANGLGKIHGG